MTDSTQVFDPGFRVTDSNGDPVSGAKIKFYAATTTTPRTVYSDSGLSSSLGSTVYCGSDGVPVASQGSSTEVLVYTGTTAYKVVITDSSDTEILTFDNIKGALDTSGFLTTSSTTTLSQPMVVKTSDYTIVAGDRGKVINANPTGGNITLTMTAATTLGDGFCAKIKHTGTANTVTLATSQTFAYAGITSTTLVLSVGETAEIVCDAAAFHLVTGLAAPIVPQPQGYLTLTSATPIIPTDVTAATTVYYTPFVGALVPIWNGARFMPTIFSELSLTLSSSHSASGIYDVFVFSNNGTLTLVTGPIWATVTAGSGARGTGAGTTQLTRTNGLWVNTVAMTGRNGVTTYSVSAGYATYLGSIFIDGTQGQVSCHRTFGQSRKWGVWNAFNRQPVILKAGDATASWNYTTATIRAANGSSSNSLTVFQGLAEEPIDLSHIATNNNTTSAQRAEIGIGYNSTSAYSGRLSSRQLYGASFADANPGTSHAPARYIAPPSLGTNVATALEYSTAGGTTTWYGTESNMLLTATWRG